MARPGELELAVVAPKSAVPQGTLLSWCLVGCPRGCPAPAPLGEQLGEMLMRLGCPAKAAWHSTIPGIAHRETTGSRQELGLCIQKVAGDSGGDHEHVRLVLPAPSHGEVPWLLPAGPRTTVTEAVPSQCHPAPGEATSPRSTLPWWHQHQRPR
uniref:Uncharacterized protein n=1 Tax=Athene cunicularia TaxID=194338 RepID=A0A663MR49_ATHCN